MTKDADVNSIFEGMDLSMFDKETAKDGASRKPLCLKLSVVNKAAESKQEIFIDICTKSKHFPSFTNEKSENDLKTFCMLPVIVTNRPDAIKFLFTILNFKIKVKDKQRQSDDQ